MTAALIAVAGLIAFKLAILNIIVPIIRWGTTPKKGN